MKSQFEVIGILRYTLPLPRISIFIILKSCLFFYKSPPPFKKDATCLWRWRLYTVYLKSLSWISSIAFSSIHIVQTNFLFPIFLQNSFTVGFFSWGRVGHAPIQIFFPGVRRIIWIWGGGGRGRLVSGVCFSVTYLHVCNFKKFE